MRARDNTDRDAAVGARAQAEDPTMTGAKISARAQVAGGGAAASVGAVAAVRAAACARAGAAVAAGSKPKSTIQRKNGLGCAKWPSR
jgi:hypothetical protein